MNIYSNSMDLVLDGLVIFFVVVELFYMVSL